MQWTNSTGALRQIVADEGSFASPILKPGQTYGFTFKTAGKYAYHDGLHPSLKGTLTVKGPPPEVTLDIGAPILVYGHSTTLTGKVSSGDSGESVIDHARIRKAPRRSR